MHKRHICADPSPREKARYRIVRAGRMPSLSQRVIFFVLSGPSKGYVISIVMFVCFGESSK